MLERAWSQLEIKAIDEAKRIVEGIATTPSVDHADDIVEPLGASFTLPLPFLMRHDSTQPVGHVISARPTKSGIPVRVQILQTDTPGSVKDRLDSAWEEIKLGLVRGLSIGFKAIESMDIEGSRWGRRFTKWQWLELSAVVIPANSDASILAIKSADAQVMAQLGHTGSRLLTAPRLVFRGCVNPPAGARSLSSPGVSGIAKHETDPEEGQ